MQTWIDVASVITAFVSVIAAVLAWIAKIRWSAEYAAAKDETIKAKEAQIDLLKLEIENLRALSPTQIREFHLLAQTELQEYVERLKEEAKASEQEIADRDARIEMLTSSSNQRQDEVLNLRQENEKLQAHVEILQANVVKVESSLIERKLRYIKNLDRRLQYSILINSIQEVRSSTDSIGEIIINDEKNEHFEKYLDTLNKWLILGEIENFSDKDSSSKQPPMQSSDT